MESNIDIVIPWVDGSDTNWLNKKRKWTNVESDNHGTLNTKARYRDYGTLKYLFRSIEMNAEWVHKVYLITDNQIPFWLNTKYDKVEVIDHEDFIPHKYLPSFNTNTIELNVHRIKGLSENFILFNDDMILNSKTKKSDFFKENLPTDVMIFNTINSHDIFSHILLNDMLVINKNFKKNDVIKRNFMKIFNIKNESFLIRSLLSLPWSEIVGFYNPHLGVSYKKSTFIKLWKKQYEILDATCSNRIRSTNDVSDWLMRYWQLCSGEFVPGKVNDGKFFTLNDIQGIKKELKKRKHKQICINDSDNQINYDENVNLLSRYLEKRFPSKSKFEL